MKPILHLSALLLAFSPFLLIGSCNSGKPINGKTAGILKGQLTIDQSGALTYDIPIEVPPGTAGVQPSLSLAYSSHAENGLLGVGWSIKGLSFITRCPATVAVDGFKGSINYDKDDRFSLDGERLIGIGGTYGDDNTIYHTQKEKWYKIVSHGTSGNGPEYFTLFTKEGNLLEYGRAENSRIRAIGKNGIRVWAVNKYTDLRGNFLTISYKANKRTGEYYPDTIKYTGNNAGLLSKRFVVFEYETRQDSLLSYAVTASAKYTVRLKKIKTFLGRTLVKSYQLNYEYNQATLKSNLSGITEYDGQNNYYPAITFSWQQGGSSFSPETTFKSKTGIEAGDSRLTRGFYDMNGDGRIDYVRFLSSGTQKFLSVALSGSNGFGDQDMNSEKGINPGIEDLPQYFADVNGDGKVDYIRFLRKNGKEYLSALLAANNTFVDDQFKSAPGIETGKDDLPRGFADVNGDGRLDYVRFVEEKGKTYLSAALAGDNGFIDDQFKSQTDIDAGNDDMPRGFYDVNGDGKADYVRFIGRGRSLHISTALASANTFKEGLFQSVDGFDAGSISMQRGFEDINGDGRTDYFCYLGSTSAKKLAVSFAASNSFSAQNFHGELEEGAYNLPRGFYDVNGDGLKDFVRFLGSGVSGRFISAGLTGAGGIGKVAFNSAPGTDAGIDAPRGFYDVNGDGKADYVRWMEDSGKLYILATLASSPFPDLIGRVTNSLGGSTAMTYRPLTNDSIYIRSNAWKYPVREAQFPMYVVTKTTADDKRGNRYSFNYTYSGSKTELNGRGWLGFAVRSDIDNQSLSKVVTYYNQTFPFTGQVDSVKTFRNSDNLLLFRSKSSYYAVTNPAVNPYRNVYQVLKQSERVDHISYGVYNYTTGKNFVYDRFGNSTVVADLGDIAVPSEALYTCSAFYNDTTHWRLGYMTSQKNSHASTQDFSSWNAGVDMTWNKSSYDTQSTMNLLSKQQYDDQNDRWLTNSFAYDVYGNVITSNDPLGTCRLYYDAGYHSFLTRKVSPANVQGDSMATLTTYDPRFGTLTSQTDANGNTMSYSLDGFGRTVLIRGPAPSAQTMVDLVEYSMTLTDSGLCTTTLKRTDWNANDRGSWYWKREYKDVLMNTFREEYRGAGEKSIVKQTVYNNRGLTSKESALYYKGDSIIWTTYQYNIYGLIDIISSEGILTKFRLNPGGKSITKTSAVGTADSASTTIVTNSRHKVVQRTDPDGSRTHYVYDRLSRLLTIKDPQNISSTTTWSSLSNKTSVVNPDMGTTLFKYGANGLLQSQTDAKGQTTRYTYDALARMITKEILGSSDSTVINYVYDGTPTAVNANQKGRLTEISVFNHNAAESKYEYKYDPYGNTSSTQVMLAGESQPYYFLTTYNPLGKTLSTTYPDNAALRLTYHADGTIDSLNMQDATMGIRRSSINYATHRNYTAMGQPRLIHYGNGNTATYTYGEKKGLLDIQLLMNARKDTLIYNDYVWDNVYRIKQIVDKRILDPGDSTLFNETQNFWYSAIGRLDSASAPGTYGRKIYDYDAAGNLTSKDNITYSSHGGTHQVRTGTKEGIAVFSALYDANGNISTKTEKGIRWNYIYDGQNQLMQVKRNDTLVNVFAYDHSGRRIKKTDLLANITTLYVSPGYEVTTYHNKPAKLQRQHTRYIDGHNGRIASITKQDTLVNLSTLASLDKQSNLSLPVHSALVQRVSHFFERIATRKFVEQACRWAFMGLIFLSVFMLVACYFFMLTFRIAGRGLKKYWVNALTPVVIFSVFYSSIFSAYGSNNLLREVIRNEHGLIPGENGAGYPVPGTLFFENDQISGTSVVTGANGGVTTRIVYAPYGVIDAQHSVGYDNFRTKFAGKEQDNSNGLYYFNARYYDPQTARFITGDSETGGDPFQPDVFNRYAYSGNNPIDYIDPSGHELLTLLGWAIVGAIISFSVSVTVQAIAQKEVDWEEAGIAAAAGFLGGVLGDLAGGAGVKFLASYVAAEFTPAGLIAAGAVIGAVSATATGLASQAFANGLEIARGNEVDWDTSMGFAAGVNALFGALSGAIGAEGMEGGGYELYFDSASKAAVPYQFKTLSFRTPVAVSNGVTALVKGVLPTMQELVSNATAFFQDAGSDDASAIVSQAFSTSGFNNTPQNNYNGVTLLGITNGEAAGYSDVLEWATTRNGMIRQWAGK